jgi:hypothetical protein
MKQPKLIELKTIWEETEYPYRSWVITFLWMFVLGLFFGIKAINFGNPIFYPWGLLLILNSIVSIISFRLLYTKKLYGELSGCKK